MSHAATRLGAVVRRITPAHHLDISIVTRASGLTPGAAAFLEVTRTYAAEVADTWPIATNPRDS